MTHHGAEQEEQRDELEDEARRHRQRVKVHGSEQGRHKSAARERGGGEDRQRVKVHGSEQGRHKSAATGGTVWVLCDGVGMFVSRIGAC